MAAAYESDEGSYSENDSDVDDESDSEHSSDREDDTEDNLANPCKYYNRGTCKDGNRCPYLHVCQYALKENGHCGSKCRLNHDISRVASSGASSRTLDQSSSTLPRLTDGRYYQWQLNSGSGWQDIQNDHILEAQYSLPHTKSIKIYNTPYGAVSIDFHRMRVYGKNLRVRRLDDGKTTWIWYCMLGRKWNKYGDKDSKGNVNHVNNADIEKKFQRTPTSSFTFSIGAETFEIKFREMRQVSKKRKRKVTRRPMYRQSQVGAGVAQAATMFQNITLGTKPQWEFEGDSGRWHTFKHRRSTSTDCSITSGDIERKYQQNQNDSMFFKVSGHSYRLDFRAMIQTNVQTKNTRRIRRVLV